MISEEINIEINESKTVDIDSFSIKKAMANISIESFFLTYFLAFAGYAGHYHR
jgi:hypothetical protein